MHVLVAFDKFKDSMSAAEACASAKEALRQARPDWTVDCAPLTDGGEGFATILTQAYGGRLETVRVADARFQPVDAKLGWVRLETLPTSVRNLIDLPAEGKLAIVEMAQASGLEPLAPEARDPWQTGTIGTGQLMRHAAREGATAILLGLGGSATNDLGIGALEALGMLAYDQRFQPLAQLTPAKWKYVASLGGIVNLRDKVPQVRIACDVDNPLLGKRGATAVFGPQKGLAAKDFDRLERLMRTMADRLLGLFGHAAETFDERKREPGSGAAGGIGFGLRTALPGTRYVPGFPLVAEWLQLAEKIARSDLVLTGEGCFDRGSLGGKGPSAILEMLSPRHRCHIFAGKVTEEARQAVVNRPGVDGVTAIARSDSPLEESLREGPALLRKSVTAMLATEDRTA